MSSTLSDEPENFEHHEVIHVFSRSTEILESSYTPGILSPFSLGRKHDKWKIYLTDY